MKYPKIQFNRPPKSDSLARKSAWCLAEFSIKLVLTLAKLMVVLMVFAMAGMYFIERDYYRRVHVQGALRHATSLAAAIQDYYLANKRYPKTLDDLRAMPDRPIEVQGIAFDGQTGVIRIHVADAPKKRKHV